MTAHRQELLQLLFSNYLLYLDEIKIVDEGSNMPSIIKQSVQVEKIGSQSYVIHYLFFNRTIEHILSFDNDEMLVKNYLVNGYHYDEAHTNIYIGNCGLNGQRNIYGGMCRKIIPAENKLCNLQVLRITKDNIEILSKMKDDIDKFESYDFIKRAVLDSGVDLYVAMNSIRCVAYMHINTCFDSNVGKKIVSPTIYTCESERRKGVAFDMLSQIMLAEEYDECDIVYGTASDNTASNKLAQKIGLSHLGTKYRYSY